MVVTKNFSTSFRCQIHRPWLWAVSTLNTETDGRKIGITMLAGLMHRHGRLPETLCTPGFIAQGFFLCRKASPRTIPRSSTVIGINLDVARRLMRHSGLQTMPRQHTAERIEKTTLFFRSHADRYRRMSTWRDGGFDAAQSWLDLVFIVNFLSKLETLTQRR